jgi:hypothetical protein
MICCAWSFTGSVHVWPKREFLESAGLHDAWPVRVVFIFVMASVKRCLNERERKIANYWSATLWRFEEIRSPVVTPLQLLAAECGPRALEICDGGHRTRTPAAGAQAVAT